eukprot:gene10787-14484_t
MTIIWILVGFVLLISSVHASQLKVIGGDGSTGLSNKSQLSDKIATSVAAFGQNLPQLTVLDCSLSRDYCCSLLNYFLDTSFDHELNGQGIEFDCSQHGSVILSSFDTIYSKSAFCGSKAVEFSKLLSDKIFIITKAINFESLLIGYEQIFRRILNRNNADAPKRTISFLMDVANVEFDKDRSLEYAKNHLKELWKDFDSNIEFEDYFSVEVIAVNIDDSDAKESTRSFILAGNTLDLLALPTSITEAWKSVESSSEVLIPLLSSDERQSLFDIETAYVSSLTRANSILNQWQARVSSGKMVGKFADRLGQLLLSIRDDFNKKTAGSLMIRERSDRMEKLLNHILTVANGLFAQQIVIADTIAAGKFRSNLIRITASSPMITEENEQTEASAAIIEEQKQALRQAVFDFNAQIADLEDEKLGLKTSEYIQTMTSNLESILKEYPESAACKLEEVKKYGKALKLNKRTGGKKKGKRGINLAFNLVGMLRPPGYGNLEGFVGYATSLLGFPLDLMLGVQNNGESPEIMGEDREYPILRIQPKVNFDIDL